VRGSNVEQIFAHESVTVEESDATRERRRLYGQDAHGAESSTRRKYRPACDNDGNLKEGR